MIKIKRYVFIIVISIILVQRFNLYEGIMYVNCKNNTNTQKVIIYPVSGNEYLHLSELKLYGENGKILYDASSSNGI